MKPIKFKNYLIDHSTSINKRILLPEGNDIRIIQSASIISKLGIAECILFGDKDIIYNSAKERNLTLSNNLVIIDPKLIYHKYINTLFSIRSHKGMTRQLASIQAQDSMILAALMLYNNEVDGVVCGINYKSSDVLRAALQIIGMLKKKDDLFLVSSVFFMLFHDRVLVYGDCAININPDAQQLSCIAIESANLASKFSIDSRIAMLSYSTGDSGMGESVDKVRQATNLVKQKRTDLIIDGPIQYDAAVNKFIAKIKYPNSVLQGDANVFIFPDLNSGNITYKAVQQSSQITSIGPIIQGLAKPINDLSRGSTINDIVFTVAITAIQSDIKK